MPRTNMQNSAHSRVFTIEDRAGPSHKPVYQTLARMGAVTWGQGDITPIRVPDPARYNRFITVDKIRGQKGLPASTLEMRMTRDLSDLFKLVVRDCPFDLHVHVGACKDPSDFDLGWEKAHVFEDANFTNYATADLGAFDADQNVPVIETGDLMGTDYYELKTLGFEEQASSEVVQEVVGVVICDSRTCGECGLPSDGCSRVFAVQVPAGASPGLPAEVTFTSDGGDTWGESIITTLPANMAPSAIACVGPYLVVISNADDSIHFALIADLFTGTETWTEVTTGIVGAGSPNDLVSLGRTQTWLVGDGGYVYTSEDITSGVDVQSAGSVTSQNLAAIDAFDDLNLLAVGAANAIIVTANGGQSWSLVTGPTGQAAVDATAVEMLSKFEWMVGYDDGTLWYTANGGTTWAQKALPGALDVIDDISFANRTVGYIAGRSGGSAKILRTISGGYSWYVTPETPGLSMPTASQFNAVAACEDDVNVVYAGGLRAVAGDGIIVKGA